MSKQNTREKYAKEAVVERLWSHTVGIANRALASQGTDPLSGLPGREEEAQERVLLDAGDTITSSSLQSTCSTKGGPTI